MAPEIPCGHLEINDQHLKLPARTLQLLGRELIPEVLPGHLRLPARDQKFLDLRLKLPDQDPKYISQLLDKCPELSARNLKLLADNTRRITNDQHLKSTARDLKFLGQQLTPEITCPET
jgi:hypothetical protein